jgi:hypothetical protein
VLAAIYLFASRPVPWTAEIVTAGEKSGLKFDEKWREKESAAGPLPALFLREAATAMRKTQVPLGLFLGSDYPINQSNMFTGTQAEYFRKLRETGEPQFFLAADIGQQTAMFADIVVAPGCANCHNEHPKSPKTDWKMNGIMGATTWSYPKDKVTLEETLQMIAVLRESFGTAYETYLAKVATFERRPEIGERWPRDGYYLPTRQVFLSEFEHRASPITADRLIHIFN